MKIDKSELAQKIKKLKNVVTSKTNNAILQGILVQDGYLIANNMELTIKVKINVSDGETFIIPVKAFDLINNLPDGTIEINTKHENGVHSITIKAVNIKNKYQVMDSSLFPLPNADNTGEEFTIESEVLLTSMKRVSYAIAAVAENTTMKTLCLHAVDGVLNFVGLDGHVLAWDKIDFKEEFKLLIPKVTVENLITIGISGKVSIRHNKNSAVFICDEFEIYTRIVDGEYFRYQTIFKKFRLHTVLSRAGLLAAMTRAKMCTKERCPVKFFLKENSLHLSIKDTVIDYDETLDLQEEMTEQMTIAFDAGLILETVKAFDCDNIGISLESSKMPMIVEAEDSDFKAVVLPVAIS